MRLHHLRLAAFQSFADEQHVDFDALARGGVFLLHGETGAGKTTVLDAVCFALYGEVPGVRNRAERLRTDHAPADVRTEVALEATLAGRRVRVTRSPKQTRARRRGPGTVVESPLVMLEERDERGEWSVIAERAGGVQEQLSGMLGLTREQFCQVVLLPQGAFAAFLHAGTDERERILQQLFETDRFADAERWLRDERARTELDLRRGLDDVGDIASRVAQVIGEEPPAGWREDTKRLREWVDERRVLAEAAEATAGGARDDAVARRAAAAEAHTTITTLLERRARRTEVLAALASHREHRAERDGAQQEARDARRADPVRPLLARLQDARTAQETAHARAVDRVHAARGAEHTAELRDAEIPTVADARVRMVELQAQAAGVRAMVAVERRNADARRAIEEMEAEIATRRRALASDDVWLLQALSTRERLSAAVEAAAASSHQLAGLTAAAGSAGDRAEAAQRRDQLATARERAAAASAHAVADELETKRAWLDAREVRLSGIAAELARELEIGTPCLVCGSTEHPAPATNGDEPLIDSTAETALRERHDDALVALSSAQADDAELAREWSAARARAGDDPAAELATIALAAQHAAAAARATAAAGPGAAQELREYERRQKDHADQRAQADAALAALLATCAERRAALDAAQAGLIQARADFPDVAAHVAFLDAQILRWEDGATALEALERAQADAITCAGAAQAESRAQGFAQLEAARAAIRPLSVIVELEAMIAAHDAREAQLQALGEDAELLAAASSALPDAATSLAALAEADGARSAAESALALAASRTEHLGGLAESLRACLAGLAPLLARRALVRSVAELADGTGAANRLRMSLPTYVLAARLEQIAAAASGRLERMSGGRYLLVHSDERAAHARSAGLGLLVVDGWTGRERPPGSLSGGESFQASLALALGLADVVSAEAGGARLETLFVDEGFGSLGEQALDDVLDVLDGLREGGRAVGVISHVSEMRQRIPTQLHIAKGTKGSQIRQP